MSSKVSYSERQLSDSHTLAVVSTKDRQIQFRKEKT